MQFNTTGVGGFSRNLIAAAVIAVCGSAMAQTGPNRVYLEQIGSSNTITVEQVGSTNQVGGTAGNVVVDNTGVTTLTPSAPSTSNYATVTGSTNVIGINQTGSNNSAQYNMTGSNNNFTSNITGNNNQNRLVMGSANAAANFNTVTETVAGDNNLILQNVQASNVTSTVNMTGSTNQVTTDLLSSRGTSNIAITGNNNVITAEQTGVAGANGHVLVNTVAGDFNSIVTQQQGSIDTVVNLQTTGSFNTITVRSSDSTIVNPATAIQR